MTRLLLAAALTLAACAPTRPVTDPTPPASSPAAPATAAPATAAAADTPLLAPWTGPHGGVPPFDCVRVEHFEPALEAAMAQHIAEVEAIAADPAAPTFDNTLAALERAGQALDRVGAVYGVWGSSLSTPEFRAVEARMDPRLAAHADQITQNAALFARIEAVYAQRASLTPEQARLAWRVHSGFVRAGARLDAAQKARLSEINQALAGLFTEFSQRVLADETDQALVLDSEADLAGVPADWRAAYAAEAARRGMPGRWAVANTRSAMEPFLTYADNRGLREAAFRLFTGRGDTGGPTDTNALIPDLLALRLERARLLGFETHAHWRTDNAMAARPERTLELMEAVWTPAVARVREEVQDMQALADRRGDGITVEPWDYRFYAEIVRAERYSLDEAAVKPYLQLDRLVDGLFFVAGELFGYAFAPVETRLEPGGPADAVPVYHEDVRVWAVSDRASGAPVGLFVFDPFARPGKRSGAWMSALREQHRLAGDVRPIVTNTSNFVKAEAGPTTISWDDATTLFHEFGHALHGLASDVTFPRLAGTSVARDYVEFPSQLLERWLATPEVLSRFAVHVETGEPIPADLVARIQRASTFNQGFSTVEFLASGLVDMQAHLATERVDAAAFERETLARYGMPREIVMRHRLPHFSHVFSGDGYAAGYYSYLWSDVITADAFEAFTEAGGPYDRAVADRLLEYVFSAGDTVDPAAGYRAFRGRDPQVDALMRARGFPTGAN